LFQYLVGERLYGHHRSVHAMATTEQQQHGVCQYLVITQTQNSTAQR
jgi:hypothetical protein